MPEFHPLIIHFPIALLSSAIFLDLLYIISRRCDLSKTGWWVLLVGLISAAAGIASGIWQDTLIGHFGTVSPPWINHGLVQVIACIIFLILFVWKNKNPNLLTHSKQKWLYIIIGGVATAILFYGGHLGAKLAGRI